MGGAERHLLTLCRELKGRNVDVVVACLREQVVGSRSLRPDFESLPVRIVDLHATHRLAWRFLLNAPAIIRSEQPDIIHTHLPRADFGGALWQRFAGGVPWICSVHDIHSDSWSAQWALPLLCRLWRQADAVIAISRAVKTWLEMDCGLPSACVTVIHYGIEPTRSDYVRQTDAIPRMPKRMVIGSVGRLEPRKGHERLIQAMPQILERIPDVCLQIAGHDHRGHRARLQRLIDELRLRDHVTLVGFQNDVAGFLAGIDLFALASRAEGFGQVLLEAMAAGKPVVASRILPLSEIVVDGTTGALADADDPADFARAICRLLSRPEEAMHMGEAGRRRARQFFSSAAMAEKTLELYDRVLSERDGRDAATRKARNEP